MVIGIYGAVLFSFYFYYKGKAIENVHLGEDVRGEKKFRYEVFNLNFG